MYTLKITNHANRKSYLTEHVLFFGVIFKALRHKTKHCPHLTMAWSVHKDPLSPLILMISSQRGCDLIPFTRTARFVLRLQPHSSPDCT